jgi:hypothetical protein
MFNYYFNDVCSYESECIKNDTENDNSNDFELIEVWDNELKNFIWIPKNEYL